VRSDYSRLASDYDAIRGDEVVERTFWVPALREVGRLGPGDRILDLGAGTGRFSQHLASFARVVATDASRDMLAQAQAKGDFPLVLGDAQRLPFRAEAFDAAVAVMVLHHLPDIGVATRELARVARRVVIGTADMANHKIGILEDAFPSLLEIDRARFPPIATIVNALETAGFRDVVVEDRFLQRFLPVPEQLDRVRRKYISTLDLIPADEFARGLAFLERELPRRFGTTYEFRTGFTFVGASR